MKLGPYPTLTEINLKWCTGLNIRSKSIKLVEENIGEKFLDFGLGNKCWAMTIKTQAKKQKIDK